MGFFDWLTGKNDKGSRIIVAPARRFNSNTVKPDNTPLHISRGWARKDKNRWEGYYRTIHGVCRGEIVRRGDRFFVYIFDPPVKQLKKHSRWHCIYDRRNKKYEIHLAKNPKDRDIDSIISYVERLIIESYRKR